MSGLAGRVAVVTGASRGIGRGIALGLGEAGATVVVTGRTGDELARVAEAVTALGGNGVVGLCDHADDEAVKALFAVVAEDHGRLDLLVNNATALPGFELLFSDTPFWQVGVEVWDGLFDVGLRSHYVAAQHAARLMVDQRQGLIVNVSSAGAQSRFAVLPYGVAKAALDRMSMDMAEELRDSRVTVVSLWPPPTATEAMLANVQPDDDVSSWSEPIFNGRVIAALAQAPDLAARSGGAYRARELAAELTVHE